MYIAWNSLTEINIPLLDSYERKSEPTYVTGSYKINKLRTNSRGP